MPQDNFQHLFRTPNKTDAKSSRDNGPIGSIRHESAHKNDFSRVAAMAEGIEADVLANASAGSTDAADRDFDPFTSTSVSLSGDDVEPSHAVTVEMGSTPRKATETRPLDTLVTPSDSRPGAESVAYIKRFLSPAIQNLRDLKLAERLNSLADNLDEYPDRVRRQLENRGEASRTREDLGRTETGNSEVFLSDPSMKRLSDMEMEEECRQLKMEADRACQRIGQAYDALVSFLDDNPHGSYQDFIAFLLMGGGRSKDADRVQYEEVESCDNYYARDSEYRKLWNDNLTLGLDPNCTTLEGRAFVPAIDSSLTSQPKEIHNMDGIDPWHTCDESTNQSLLQSPSLQDKRRSRTLSGDRLKQLSQIDRQKLASSAFNVLSNVSSLAMKPLRDLQLAEKVNAMQLDIEEEETRREIQRYHLRQEEKRDLEEMMKVKKEAEERTLTLTKDHLTSFLREHPDATYQEWIEDLHPENAHDGTLLEGFGKTIDHRFFVEESDHRRLWNENLTIFLNGEDKSRYVPPRPRQIDDSGELVVATDLLSGPWHDQGNVDRAGPSTNDVIHSNEECASLNRSNDDFIGFD